MSIAQRWGLAGFLGFSLALAAFLTQGCSPAQDDGSIHVAYVTNGVASFWDIAKAGAEAGGQEFDVKVTVKMPPNGEILEQKEILEDLMSQGYDGIAVSPINPENQTAFLNEVGNMAHFITHDADAPDSNRKYYIGMDNYEAGRMCGQLVKEAIPDGGEVMIFVGRVGQLNADLRRQGVIDELLDRDPDSSRRDPQDGVLKGEKYTILGTRTDGFDPVKAKEEAQDAIIQYPDVKAMVGLFAYNPPAILSAIKDAGKQDAIEVIGFDEADETLAAIRDGEIVGTIVQNPFEYGRQSVKVLAAMARNDKEALPTQTEVYIPARTIRKDNVIEFWTELNENLGLEPPTAAAGSNETGNE